ncbi:MULTISPECIES: MFS transporter [unclassified Clostridioides]|uniref:MFS transporter n=1 Tax=unclassified Clostridioides TaxID=2635829 RepID=UPI001D0C26E8|nr:MFS transporter [Clostridioides sp. ES-S-0001-02]MCC0641268.1 MFS transporter [Clostridioides sp. ES-S-0049-03]MCC0653824.1 MFS transporter [Clostridioides sp. ES-S-0001-03]MCC0658057.1 MFS transporter [Clostridioides sp. ES-S-0123-01]MCC0670970.1 MFS transporter [Clostridioides sp. ES-S-0145-01]MCC0677484.1 MFS transporter [Clostridioides sp. ES-W-0018-02]MCC0681987.1 MFS transporter [Clostridioides sp. ES-S-0005-03]MCC0696722.1 MFS transporter [Clostridioides sp. ES-S-0048-02]MCC070434
MENKSNVKRFLVIFILAFGTTAMYSLPYMKSSFYDPMQQALALSHTQIGNLLSLYGLVGMVSYFIGGWFADRFSVRKLITFSLIASGALGFYFSTFPSYNMILLIFVLWGFTTILTFFSASVKVVRMQGSESEQGRIFGFYEGLSGVSGTLISFIGLYFFGKFAEITIGFKYVVWLYSAASIICGILLFFLVEEKKDTGASDEGLSIKSLLKVVTMPKAWLIGLIIFSTYLVFSSLTYLSPYLSEVYVMPMTLVSALSIIRTYVIKMGASPIAGVITDKVGSSIRVMFVGFILMTISTAAYLVIPKSAALIWIAVINMIILSVILFGFRGIYFASVSESNISLETTGAVVGFASFIGFSPDAFYYTVAGNWLDKYGQTGYTYIFILSVVCAVIGIFATYALNKINKKENKNLNNKIA